MMWTSILQLAYKNPSRKICCYDFQGVFHYCFLHYYCYSIIAKSKNPGASLLSLVLTSKKMVMMIVSTAYGCYADQVS